MARRTKSNPVWIKPEGSLVARRMEEAYDTSYDNPKTGYVAAKIRASAKRNSGTVGAPIWPTFKETPVLFLDSHGRFYCTCEADHPMAIAFGPRGTSARCHIRGVSSDLTTLADCRSLGVKVEREEVNGWDILRTVAGLPIEDHILQLVHTAKKNSGDWSWGESSPKKAFEWISTVSTPDGDQHYRHELNTKVLTRTEFLRLAKDILEAGSTYDDRADNGSRIGGHHHITGFSLKLKK